MLKEKIVLLFANPYNMVDKETGRTSEGVTVAYLYGESMAPMMQANGAQGQRPAKGSLRTDLWGKIPCAPALYNGHFEMAIGSDGKPTLRLVDLDYVSMLDVQSVEEFKPKVGGAK